MIDLKNRSNDPEIMDDLALDNPALYQTLRELDVINTWLGGNAISSHAYKKLTYQEQNVVLMDMGCGSGSLLQGFARWSEKKSINFCGIGIDANPHIVNYADQHNTVPNRISFEAKDVFDPSIYDRKIDIIHACLFTHHFDHDQLVWLFRQWKMAASKGVIINDLHRHPFAYYSIKWLTRLFSNSYMVKYDACLSVARGFSRKELMAILKEAGIEQYSLKWKWAFRWLLVF